MKVPTSTLRNVQKVAFCYAIPCVTARASIVFPNPKSKRSGSQYIVTAMIGWHPLIRSARWGLFFVLFCFTAAAQQVRPDFSGRWVLDAIRSGSEPETWLQRRPLRFMIQQTTEELTMDTGGGSLFGVSSAVTESPLRYKFDGSTVTVVDHSLGDIPTLHGRSARRPPGKAT